MKQVFFRSVIISFLAAILIETRCYLKMWRLDFYSAGEFFSILTFTLFIFLVVFPAHLLILKLIKEREVFQIKARVLVGLLSLVASVFIIYIDDEHTLVKFSELGTIVGVFVCASLIFLISSFIFLVAKRKL